MFVCYKWYNIIEFTVNKISASKVCGNCDYWYFLNKGFKFQLNVCNRFNDLSMSFTYPTWAIWFLFPYAFSKTNLKIYNFLCLEVLFTTFWESKTRFIQSHKPLFCDSTI